MNQQGDDTVPYGGEEDKPPSTQNPDELKKIDQEENLPAKPATGGASITEDSSAITPDIDAAEEEADGAAKKEEDEMDGKNEVEDTIA